MSSNSADITHEVLEILNENISQHSLKMVTYACVCMQNVACVITPADQNKREDLPIGVIPIDSIYTPVSRVNFQVENTRVGQSSDYDKLSLDVWTDGSISPREAISLGAKILTEHLNIFVDMTHEAQTAEIMVEKEENLKRKI